MAYKVSVIGAGYIGLPLAAILAKYGNDVVCVDINKDIVASINSGISHIKEDELNTLFNEAFSLGNLRASCNVDISDVFIITVPTPLTKDMRPDLSMVFSAVESIVPVLKDGDLIIIESTVSIGATNEVLDFIKSYKPNINFNLAYCPERILPGDIVNELINNNRIIGGVTDECGARAKSLYMTFVLGDLVVSSAKVAESVKLVENTYRDINIGFANELSMLFHKLDINTNEVIKYANMHPRVDILKPGPGVGGHCIAIDPVFLANSDSNYTPLMQCARKVNMEKENFVFNQVQELCKINSSKDLYWYGLTYKPNVADLRESPSLNIAKSLSKSISNKIFIVEPNISMLPEELRVMPNVELIESNKSQDGIHIYLVAHKEFKSINRTAEMKFLEAE
jgi:UDP-N-acetyl-D-mannosaminuronic acid dehydrogenase